MARRTDTDKDKAYDAYPLITESEHDELTKIGQRKWPRTLTPEEGAKLEAAIDKRINSRKARAVVSAQIKSQRSRHPSFKYTAAGRRAASKKKIVRKS